MTVSKEVLDLLKDKVANKPNTEQLQLDYMHINDLLPYMELLSQLRSLRKLSLYGNRLKQLPIEMSSLKELESLDLSNNLLNDVEMVVVSLQTLPKLKVLKYPVKKQKQNVVVEGIKGLTLFNDLHIIRQPAKKPIALKYMNESTLGEFKQKMAEQLKKIQQIEATYLGDKSYDTSLEKYMIDIDAIIKEGMKVVADKEGDLTESLEIIYFNKTKYMIYDQIKTRCVNIGMDYYGDLGRLIKEVMDVQTNLFDELLRESLKLVESEYELFELKRETKESNNMNVEHKVYAKNDQLEKQIKRIKKQKDELIIEINQLESENKRYLQSLVRFAKGDKSGMVNAGHTHFSRQTNNNQSFSQSFVPMQVVRPLERPSKPAPSAKETSIPSNYMSNGRNLTLKQLKDTIEEIYEGKVKFDQKNFDGKIPRETMHQYLFTHLNQKYGLKNLTIEAASSIVAGIQSYSIEDNDVAVFGKILKNEIDEEFRNVQTELKTTINSLIKIMVKNKVPYKSAAEIDAIVKEKLNGEVMSDEVEEIVKYLYNKEDSDRILHKIQLLYKLNKKKDDQQSHRRTHKDQTSNEREKKRVRFSVFLQTVLDFQLKNHERLLRPLLSVFKSRDRDSDGIVNQEQFISIIEELCEEATDVIPDMLMIVDPYETKSITYTQVVRLVANYPENNPILSRFIDKDTYIDDMQ